MYHVNNNYWCIHYFVLSLKKHLQVINKKMRCPTGFDMLLMFLCLSARVSWVISENLAWLHLLCITGSFFSTSLDLFLRSPFLVYAFLCTRAFVLTSGHSRKLMLNISIEWNILWGCSKTSCLVHIPMEPKLLVQSLKEMFGNMLMKVGIKWLRLAYRKDILRVKFLLVKWVIFIPLVKKLFITNECSFHSHMPSKIFFSQVCKIVYTTCLLCRVFRVLHKSKETSH